MAIKFNGQDLVKRLINWQEVSKIMKGSTQIRPTYIPPTPQPTYHIMWDFATAWASGSLPSGWSGSGWWYTTSGGGVTSNSDNQAVYLEPDSMPDLSRASRIVVETWFTMTSRAGFANLISGGGSILTSFNGNSEVVTINTSSYSESAGLTMPYTGLLTTTYSLCDEVMAQQIDDLTYEYDLSDGDIARLRSGTDFQFQMSGYTPVTLSSLDFYIWNTDIMFDRTASQVSCNLGDTITIYWTATWSTAGYYNPATLRKCFSVNRAVWTDTYHTAFEISLTATTTWSTYALTYSDLDYLDTYKYDTLTLTVLE